MGLTDFLLQSLLGLDVVLFELVIEFLERLKILNGNTHLLDFLQRD